MTIAWIALWLFSWLKQADPVCSPTSYYRNCWIRRFPGLYIAVEESERRGAALLQLYQEESALQCSRACCLAANFSCNLAVYHYNTTQDSANCFHLHCPTLESCILRQRGNVILYNVTKGVDPDLLVFGKHFTSNYQVLPNHASSRVNISEPFASDKRQFNRPHVVPSSSAHPATPAISTSTSTISPTSEVPVSTTPVSIDYTHNIPPVPSIRRSTLRSPTSPSNPVNQATQGIANHSPNPTTTASTKWASTAPQNTLQPSSVFYTSQKSLTLPSQPPTTATTVSPLSNHPIPGSTYEPTTTTWASMTAPTSSQNMVTSTTEFAASQTTMASANSQTAWESTTASTATQTTWASTTASTATRTTWASTTASTATQTTWASTTASTTSHASSTTFITLTSSNSTALNSKPTTTIPLISTQQNTTDKTSVHSTLATVQLSSTNAASALTPVTTLKTTTVQPQMAGSHTTIAWPYLQPTNTTYSNSAVAGGNTQSPPTDGQVDTSTNGTTTEHSTTSSGPTTSTTLSSPPAASVTTSLTPPTSMEDSQPYPNDTKGYISRNITTGDNPRPGGDGGSTPVWHLAANTVLVALATCATIAFGCCCSVLMAVSWRGRRRRKGRYRTTLRGKSGSMRLIKYVIVRESS